MPRKAEASIIADATTIMKILVDFLFNKTLNILGRVLMFNMFQIV